MKALSLSLLSLLAATFAYGDVVMVTEMSSPQMNGSMTAKFKGSKVRTDMPQMPGIGATSSIMDTQSGDMLQIMHGQKMDHQDDGRAAQAKHRDGQEDGRNGRGDDRGKDGTDRREGEGERNRL